MDTYKIIILLCCLLSLMAGFARFSQKGNSRLGAYLKNRVQDAADIITVTGSLGTFGVKLQIGPLGLGMHYQGNPVLNMFEAARAWLGTSPAVEYGLKQGVMGGRDVQDTTVLLTLESEESELDGISLRGKKRMYHTNRADNFSRKLPAEQYSQIEISAGFIIGIRLGFNPGELVDFLLGFFGIDIYEDDIYKPQVDIDFIMAVRDDRQELAKSLLLNDGANPDAGVEKIEYHDLGGARSERFQHTPFIYAVLNGHDEIVELLLERGANPDTVMPVSFEYKDRATMLQLAIESGYLKVAEALLEHGADTGLTDNKKRTALMYGALYDQQYIAERLLQKGADVEAKDSDGRTALMFTAMNEYVDMAGLLIKNGADVNAADNAGKTALMFAAAASLYKREPIHNNSVEVVRLFLENGADVNRRGGHENATALLFAVKNIEYKDIHADIVRLLLKNGAKVNIRDNNGRTALYHTDQSGEYLMEKERRKIAQMLKAAGATR